jgi:hypothetical protein
MLSDKVQSHRQEKSAARLAQIDCVAFSQLERKPGAPEIQAVVCNCRSQLDGRIIKLRSNLPAS